MTDVNVTPPVEKIDAASVVTPNDQPALALRNYPGWVTYAAYLAVLVTGTWSMFAFTVQNRIDAPFRNGEVKPFDGALVQTFLMFIGMSLALAFAHGDRIMSARQGKQPLLNFDITAPDSSAQRGVWWHWSLIAGCDFIGTVLMTTALKFTLASTQAMLRNLMVVFCALLQIPFQRRAVRLHEWFGVIIITAAMILNVIPSLSGADEDDRFTVGDHTIGIILAISGCAIQTTQLQMEELLIRKGLIPPMEAVGYEGIGGIFYCFILWAVYEPTGMETVSDNWHQVFNHGGLLTVSILYILFGALIFNVSGLASTKLGSSLLRSVLMVMRAPFCWLILLACKWEKFNYWALSSALVFMVGVAFYSNCVGLKRGSVVDQYMWSHVHFFGKVGKMENDREYPYAEMISGKCVLNAVEVPPALNA